MPTVSTTADRVTPAPVPEGYRLAELEDTADREAMIDVDRWAFAFELEPADEAVAVWDLEPGRSVGVWDERGTGRRLAAVHSSYAFELPVPGGRRLPAAGLTWVGVHPAHRRRGLSRAMLTAHLDRSARRGEMCSVLNAAETGIYGRYGYGVATHKATATLGRGADLRDVPGAGDLVVDLERHDHERHGETIQRVHTSVERPGWIHRPTPALRAAHVTDWPSLRREVEGLRIALVRTAAGEARGYALFRRKENWSEAGVPQGTVRVKEAVALDAAAARALWATLTDLDLMGSVKTGPIATDDPLLHLLTDLRGAQVRLHDDVWLRLLDVPAALRARAYQAPVDVVLEVTDPLVAANAGRWHVRGGPDGAEVTAARGGADVRVDVADLGSAYLGGTSLAALAGAGRVTATSPGTLMAASAAFGWPLAPATSWGF